MSETVGFVVVALGLIFNLLGCLGLVRMPDVYTRLQASTKCVTLGTGCILLGTFIATGFTATGVKALLCLVFVSLSASTAAHALARGVHQSGIKLWKGSVVDKYEEDKGK